MNHSCLLFAFAGAMAGLSAQANPFVFFPQDPERQGITCASYVGRPDWNNQAEGFQEIGTNWIRGVGDETGTSLAHGFYHWAADEDVATTETYGIILRRADPTGAIDTTTAGEIVRVTGLTLPTNPAGGRGGWIMSDIFATPVVVPNTQSWFMGLDFPANPAWPATDGHSYWRADVAGISPATVGENPRSGAPRTNWTVQPTGTAFSNGWSTIMGVLVDTPTLHVGGLDPNNSRQGTTLPNTEANYGLGGQFPDISGTPRSDGITLRVQDNVAPQGIAFFVGALGWANPVIPVLGITGQFHLDLALNVGIGFRPMTNGAAELPVNPPGAIAPVFVGVSLKFQGLVYDPATGAARFTNAQTTEL
ncbi:MAG: hypothetical protein U1E73_10430 [Planctomycetota bacterium]